MYLLANKFHIALGVFTTKETLNMAIFVCRTDEPGCRLYYQKIQPDVIDSTLIQFWTMHPEKMIEIGSETNVIE